MDEIYGLLIWLPRFYENYFVIENVQPYYVTLTRPTFKVGRHLFWANFSVPSKIKKKNQWKHGQIGGIMRENKSTEERNMVDPEIGKYILDYLRSKPTLINRTLMEFLRNSP